MVLMPYQKTLFNPNCKAIRRGDIVVVLVSGKKWPDKILIDVKVTHILKGVTDKGFEKSGKQLMVVEYINPGITNDPHNENHIIRFEHPETDYKWAFLHQIRR